MPNVFPQMVKVVPEGKCGVAEVRHVAVSQEQSRMTALGGYRGFVEAGKYAQLFVNNDMVMSDTGYERRTNNVIVQQANGRVLVAGYGLGMILTKLLTKPTVEEVVVVEKYADVVALVDPHIKAHVGAKAHRKLDIIVGDINDAKNRVKDDRFDALWFDIWADVSTDALTEMTALTRKYRSLRRSKDSFMACWDREWLRYRKSQERRMGW